MSLALRPTHPTIGRVYRRIGHDHLARAFGYAELRALGRIIGAACHAFGFNSAGHAVYLAQLSTNRDRPRIEFTFNVNASGHAAIARLPLIILQGAVEFAKVRSLAT